MKYWVINTNNKIEPKEIEDIRNAISGACMLPAASNKISSTGKPSQDYAKIQYKILGHAFAMVVLDQEKEFLFWCMNHLHGLKISIPGRQIQLSIRGIVPIEWKHIPTQTPRIYISTNYIPFSSEKEKEFSRLARSWNGEPATGKKEFMEDPVELRFLENLVKEHLLTVAEMDAAFGGQSFSLSILNTRIPYVVSKTFHRHKNNPLDNKTKLTHIEIRTNLPLSPHLGYGKLASIGFGMFDPLSVSLT